MSSAQNVSPNEALGPSQAELARAHREDLLPDLPAPENKKFYPALDGLRAIAVLMVFCEHYLNYPAVIVRWGWAGVDIFFVLSGFLITGILYDTRNTMHRVRNFYVRRTLRIFPLFYAVMLTALAFYPWLHWRWHPVWLLWPIYLGNFGRFLWLHDYQTTPVILDHLMTSRHFHPPLVMYFGHFWSLCVEEQFYLAWPLAVFLIKDRVKLRNICVAAFFLAALGRVLCMMFLPHDLLAAGFLERFTPLRIDSLLLGGFVALCLRGPEAGRIQRYALPVMSVSVGAFALLQAYFLVTQHHIYRGEGWWFWPCTVGYSFVDLFAAGLILRAIDASSVFYRLLENRFLRRLGQISYGFYVFHDIFHQAVGRCVQRLYPFGSGAYIWMVAGLSLVLTVFLAYTSFRFFEAPFLRLKEHFTVQARPS